MLIRLLGFLVAFFSAGIGIGGGCILVPSLMTIFNFDFRKAASISLFTIIPISLVGAISHFLFTSEVSSLKYFLFFIPACMLGTFLGGTCIKKVNGKWVKSVFSIFIFLVGIKMLGISNFIAIIFTYIDSFMPNNHIITLIPFALLVGFTATLLGVGCGLVIVPFFVIIFKLGMHQAILISLVSMFFLTSTASIVNQKLKTLDTLIVKKMIWPALMGGIIGAICSNKLPDLILKKVFASFLILISIKYFIDIGISLFVNKKKMDI